MYDSSNESEVEQYVLRFAPLVKRIAHHMMASLPPSREMAIGMARTDNPLVKEAQADVDAARHFGMQVVAEGVETPAQRDLLLRAPDPAGGDTSGEFTRGFRELRAERPVAEPFDDDADQRVAVGIEHGRARTARVGVDIDAEGRGHGAREGRTHPRGTSVSPGGVGPPMLER